MGLLSKALKTAAKAADAAKDASRTKPKSQMNPLVKARKKPAETDFDKSASQEVKDFLSAVEEKDPNQLGEFYSPVVSTLEEMPIGKQGTKGENISAFIQKRAPSITGSEKGNLPKLDPKKKYTREEAIETLKPIDKSYSIEINQNPAYQNPNQRGNQRQNITDKEESYFEVFVKQKDIDPEIEEVSGGHFQDAGILAHTRSSIRRETPAGGPLTKKIKDRERYLLIEEMQSDVANLVEKNVDELGMSRISEDAREVFAEEGPQGNFANEVVDNLGTPFNKEHENILNDWYTKIRKRTDLGYVIGENYSKIQDVIDLKRIYKDVLNIDVGGRTPEQIHKNASVRLYENDVDPDELIMNFGDSEYDIGEYFDETFNYYLKLSTDVSKKERKFGEITYPKSAVPLNTRTEYVTKLIQANIVLAKKQGVTKIVIPDYKEIARLRDHIQTDGNKEDIFKMTYEDAVNKALKSLIKESKGQIKVGKRELKYNSAEARGNRKSTATEIDISDFDFNPDTQAFRFNKGGIVPMNNQTQQAFALGGLKDEGGEIDEVSGNSVPIGGTKEGVRDDIPANVSEGEFIFPADVVRYHGLDKMMALRQEAKMGLKQMERMGQMGNSDEATIPDDLPFSMADLIVVSGEGKPMEFNEGGFVDLEVADVPMMGDPNTGVNYTRINYDDYMNPPLVMMKEYRNADGESILISFVNGVATTEIPEGYTLYTPPTNTAPTTTQAAIQIVNRRSYSSTASDDGPEPTPTQPAPDYRNMNDNEFFSYMAQQNSFGAKAGNAVATAISLMIPFPGVGILTQVAMRNHKNNLMNNMKSRIDRMVDGPAKTAALANFKEYGGETDPKKKEGLLTNITNFVNGFVGDVGKLFGISPEEAAKAAQNAAVTEVSGAGSAIESATSAAPTTSLKPMLRPDVSTTVPVTQTGPQGTIGYNIGQVDPRLAKAAAKDPRLTAIENQELATREDEKTDLPTDTLASQQNRADTALRIAQIDEQEAKERLNAFNRQQLIDRNEDQGQPTNQVQQQMDAMRNQASTFAPAETVPQQSANVRSERTGPDFDAPEFNKNLIGYDEAGVSKQPPNYAFIPKSEPTINPVSTQEATYRQDALTDAGLIANEVLARPNEPFLDAAARYARQGFDTFIAGDKNRGYFNPVNEQIDAAVAGAQDTITSAAVPSQPKPYDFSGSPSAGYDEAGVQMQDPRDARVNQQFGNDNYIDPNVVPSNEQSLYTGASGEGYGIGQVDPRLAAAVQTQQALNIPTPTQTQQDIPTGRGINMTVPAPKETAAQARAREAAAQRARIQTRNKEIAAATSKIPARILNSKVTQDAIKAGYTGSTTGGYAIGKISGSDGDLSGVVQKADGKVQKLRDVQGYEGLSGTQRGAMTVYKDEKGTAYVKNTFGKKTKLDGSKYTGSGGGSSGGSGSSASAGRGNTSSGRTVAQIQADINKEVGGGKAWTSKANALVAEREAAKKAAKSSSSGGGGSSSSSSSTTSSSSSKQSGTGFFRGADESGNTGSDSSKGGYSCYVATALSEKGYWSHTQKIKLIKWCMEAKPEGKLDTILWRNGYCIFGKNIIAPKVDNKIIQWLSNGFYHATISNKKTLQAILGKLFFIIPSYTIGIWKALRGSLVDIERT